MDYGRLARIDTLVNSYISKGWVHGVVTLVVKGVRSCNTRDMAMPMRRVGSPCIRMIFFG